MSSNPVVGWPQRAHRDRYSGLGVVGSGTFALLERNRAEIERKIGLPFHIKRIAVRDIQKKRFCHRRPRLADEQRLRCDRRS